MATPISSWGAPSPHLAVAQPAPPVDDAGVQARPMGLKVHYTFDRDGQVHCLARWPHTLHIQTIPLDERTTIGVVDLRTCLQAVAQCSPEIVNQLDSDFSVYAYDYSEPDVPLVGQGMLSWGLESHNDMHQQQQLVTGRVTRNILAILGNGSRETLEVKLKLTAVAKMMPRTDFSALDAMAQLAKAAPTPTPGDPASEWDSFIRSNPMLGHSASVASMPSPAMAPAHPGQSQFSASMTENRAMSISDSRPADSRGNSIPPPTARPASIPPSTLPPIAAMPTTTAGPASIPPKPLSGPTNSYPTPENAPSPVAIQTLPTGSQAQPAPGSRPASRTSRSRSRVPTGRPRGRPRKKPLETGNTSAAEEATDGDEGPQRKRAKVTRTEYSAIAPFGSAPDSLRVAASTSGSLRTMRPVGAGSDAPSGNHLQDVPRAPTPIPDGALLQQQHRRRAMENRARSGSQGATDNSAYQSQPSQRAAQSLGRDAKSPAESIAPSPDHGYSPEDSAGDLGSSPPVPRTSAYLGSSPTPSSPILPTMPMQQVDSGFMSGGIDDFFDEEDILHDLSMTKSQDLPGHQSRHASNATSAPPPNKRSNADKSRPQPPPTNFPFQEVNPGPPELLPLTSLYNPPVRKSHAKPAESSSAPPMPKKAASRPLKRSNTAPNRLGSETGTPENEGDQAAVQRCEPELPQATTNRPAASPEHSFSSTELAQLQSLKEATEGPVSEAPEPVSKDTNQSSTAPPAPPIALPERRDRMPVPPRPNDRSVLRGTTQPPVPASDPAAEHVSSMPRPFMSEAPCPPSDCDPPRYNKNLVKKQTIKERLEIAISKGESPPFCNNCGAIETPTWRKVWTQDHHGVPEFHELSDKPGSVTMIDILERDDEGNPSLYRLVKKNLGITDDKKKWTETLLCNPCGIWFGKFKGHRPPERWEKDAARLNQPRKKKGANARKRSRTKSDGQMNPTSEAYFTDPLGPAELEERDADAARQSRRGSMNMGENNNLSILNLQGSPKQRGPGSTHSRGSGTADSPIAVEDDLGSTRRLLFPSPRKEGVAKVLGELAANTVQTALDAQEQKSAGAVAGKENNRSETRARPDVSVFDEGHNERDLDQELFGTPPPSHHRPSTPPPKGPSGPFKTPTRPTPSHRPITRSISRSIRTIRTLPKSPGQHLAHVQRTPSKTPRSGGSNSYTGSATKRRSPRHGQHLHAHFVVDQELHFDSPFTTTLNQLLSEANDFTAGSPSHGLVDLDLSHLPALDGDANAELHAHLAGGHLDFGNFLSTDLMMPSSPPLMRSHAAVAFGGHSGGDMTFGADFEGSLWEQLAGGPEVKLEES